MGVDTAPAIAAALIEHGRAPDSPAAIVSNGSTATQRTIRTTLADLPRTMTDEGIRPPAVWVAGDVVGLMERHPETPDGGLQHRLAERAAPADAPHRQTDRPDL
jgi:uroporphyrin-III C-methyltransferase/precorrin-2 dehydrogenase/sirohydrochlorin ferrochelatase